MFIGDGLLIQGHFRVGTSSNLDVSKAAVRYLRRSGQSDVDAVAEAIHSDSYQVLAAVMSDRVGRFTVWAAAGKVMVEATRGGRRAAQTLDNQLLCSQHCGGTKPPAGAWLAPPQADRRRASCVGEHTRTMVPAPARCPAGAVPAQAKPHEQQAGPGTDSTAAAGEGVWREASWSWAPSSSSWGASRAGPDWSEGARPRGPDAADRHEGASASGRWAVKRGLVSGPAVHTAPIGYSL